MRVAERLEEHVLVTAREHDTADDVVIPQQEMVEDGSVVLVVHLEFRRDVEAAREHVRPGPLQPHEIDRRGEPRRTRMRPAPLPLGRGDARARHRVELILLDKTRESLGATPAKVAAHAASKA